MAAQQHAKDSGPGVVTYIISWIVGFGVFALLILAALSLIHE